MSSQRTRPARSNSLQRMLELERRYMLERLQSTPNSNPNSKIDAVSRPPPATSHRPVTQAYHIESSAKKDARKSASTIREKMAITQIVPLTINISSTDLRLDATTETVTDAQTKTVILPQNQPGSKPVLKAVSFDVPLSNDEDERRSICQSPSWEAYGRRKKTEKKDIKKEQKKEQLKKEQQKKEEERKEQERKEQLKKEQLKKEQLKKEQLKKEQQKKEQLEKEQRKKEQQQKPSKREKEESILKNALIKKKRLSKQPPASSPHALDQANRMTSAVAASRDKQRPSSALEFTTPSRDDMPNRSHHGRSGSFTSMIRNPFESRRASLETSRPSETGFIGGIKLEIQRHAASQKTVEGPENMDESKIHPALRTNNAHNQKWSAPPARPNPESQRRAYPPITRHPAAAAKTRSLISSAEMDASDAGTMDRWRAFVGLKPREPGESSKASTQQQASKQPVVTNEATKSAPALPPPQTDARDKAVVAAPSQTSRGPGVTQPDLPNSGGKALDQSSKPKLTVSTAIPLLNTSAAVQRPQSKESTAQPSLAPSIDGMKSGEITDTGVTQNVASSQLSLPPAPPRRSSKRNSLLSLNSVSSVSSPHSPAHRPSSSDSSNSNHDQTAAKSRGISESHTTAMKLHERTHNSPNLATGAIEQKGVDTQGGGASLRTTSTPREASRIARNHKPDPIDIPLWDDIESSVLQVIDTKVSLSPIRKSHNSLRDDSDFTVRRLTDGPAPTASGDDSSSDDFHSISMPGTPDTSRPQSEKDVPPMKDAESKRLATESRMRNSSQSPARQPLLLQSGAGSSQSSLGSKNPRPMAKTTTTVVTGQAVHHRIQLEADVIPGADFLPKLKHQPLPLKMVEHVAIPKQQLQSTVLVPGPASYLEEARKATPLAPPPPLLGSPRLGPKVTPPSSIRSQPSSTSDLALAKAPRHVPGSPVVGGEPIAKMFVECCGCKYFHDMPSNLYEAMANPEAIIRPRGNVGFAGAVSMTVKCPWCSHEMSTKCCAGYAAMVYVKERLH